MHAVEYVSHAATGSAHKARDVSDVSLKMFGGSGYWGMQRKCRSLLVMCLRASPACWHAIGGLLWACKRLRWCMEYAGIHLMWHAVVYVHTVTCRDNTSTFNNFRQLCSSLCLLTTTIHSLWWSKFENNGPQSFKFPFTNCFVNVLCRAGYHRNYGQNVLMTQNLVHICLHLFLLV